MYLQTYTLIDRCFCKEIACFFLAIIHFYTLIVHLTTCSFRNKSKKDIGGEMKKE